jgi:tetratricopeptide (TPR) repeat protein
MKRLGIAVLLIVVSITSTSCDMRDTIATLAMHAGKFEFAMKLFRGYVAEHPTDIVALRRLSQIECYQLSEYDSCAAHADSLLNQYPIDSAGVATGTFAHTMLAGRAANIGDSEGITHHMGRVGDIHRLAGYWNYMNENFNHARGNFEQLIHIQPDSVYSYLRIGQIHWHRHRDDTALAWFRKAQEVDPTNEDALINQIFVLRDQNKIDEALAMADQLDILRRELYPDSSFSNEADTLAFPTMSLNYRGDTDRWMDDDFAQTGPDSVEEVLDTVNVEELR